MTYTSTFVMWRTPSLTPISAHTQAHTHTHSHTLTHTYTQNFYHVLECDGGSQYSPEHTPTDPNNYDDVVLASPTLSQHSSPSPVYHEIMELSTRSVETD